MLSNIIMSCFKCFGYNIEEPEKKDFQNKNEIKEDGDRLNLHSKELINKYANEIIKQLNDKIQAENERKIKNNDALIYQKLDNSDSLVEYINNLLNDHQTTDMKASIINFTQSSIRYQLNENKKYN